MAELLFLSILGWMSVGAEPYFPRSLGGTGDMMKMFSSGQRFVPGHLAVYHAVRFSYLLEWWIFEDGLQRPYLTMHHIATSVLLTCAVFAGQSQIGSIIIFLHDVPNLPLQLVVWMQGIRTPIAALVLVYLLNLYVWAHFTLYSFPMEIIWASLSREHAQSLEWKIYWCMFALLLVHHVYAYVRLLVYIPKVLCSPQRG
mmetsp:Transcript_2536/g.3510  ORF Transcript_2536/g.3510 Transcript_2536/m.3510 type:complete len:199 (+) Transcript_2536:223-819(+)